MRAALVLIYALIFLSLIEFVCSSINEFFSQVTSDIGSALQTAWTKITNAMKKPVRIRRVGRGGRRKTMTVTTTAMTPPSDMSTIAIYLFSKFTRPAMVKPTIPVFTKPPFKSVVEWRKQQIPYLLRPIKGIEGKPVTTPYEDIFDTI